MKLFRVMHNVGKARYLISTHDGVKTHHDGSPFYDIEIFKQKRKFEAQIRLLKAAGYTEV